MFRGAYPVRSTEMENHRRQRRGSCPTQRVHTTPGIAVLSLGNPLRGDDGIGSRIVEHLQAHPRLPGNVTLIDANILRPEYLLCMNTYRHVLIVDAVEIGEQAGEWLRIEIEVSKINPDFFKNIFSSHDLHLTDYIVMGCVLNLWPPSIELYAVQPAQFDWGASLSKRVRDAIPSISDEIVHNLLHLSHRVIPSQ